jgi:hypothetical protein
MQEASRWRDGLAQQIVSHAQLNPKVAAMLVEGSVARDAADRFSDLDLAVFWTEPPTPKERRDIVIRAGGSSRHAWPSHGEAIGWSERFEKEGIPIDIRHTTVTTTKGIIAAVVEHADPRLSKQQCLAALRSSLPLLNLALIKGWQQQAAAYPDQLAGAMVRKYLRFHPAWEQVQMAERHELLVLYDSLCSAQKQFLFVLLGLNHLYFPGWRWLDCLIDEMQVTPGNLAQRLKQLFAIVSIDPLAAVYQLHDLIEETFRLVEVDIHAAHQRFRRQRRAGERTADGLG